MEKKAFTLLEILIVVLILGILINLAVPTIKGARIKTRLGGMLIDVSQLERTIDYLYAEGVLEGWRLWGDEEELKDGFAEYYHVDVPEDNDYFHYEIVIGLDERFVGIQVSLKTSPLWCSPLCQRGIYYKDVDPHKKGYRYWLIFSTNEWSKYLKALLPDADVY